MCNSGYLLDTYNQDVLDHSRDVKDCSSFASRSHKPFSFSSLKRINICDCEHKIHLFHESQLDLYFNEAIGYIFR